MRGIGEESLNLTELLRAWSAGDEDAFDRLTTILHGELRRIASAHMARERKDHTLQPTALVNEAFLRLAGARAVEWQDRAHFFAIAAQVMRRILVNHALANRTAKRGGPRPKVPLEDVIVIAPGRDEQLVALDEALQLLATIDSRKARVIELRFFAGLTVEETAHVLEVSPQTVLRDWSLAKVWLAREMSH